MSQHFANSTVSLFAGIDGDVQLAVGSSGHLILDCQGAERGTDGALRHNHGTVRLTLDAALELADFIERLGEPEDARQPALWSEATFVQPIRPPVRARRRKLAGVAAVLAIVRLFAGAPARADDCPPGVACLVQHPAPPPLHPPLFVEQEVRGVRDVLVEIRNALRERSTSADLIAAMSAQQTLLSQLLVTQQEILGELREIRAK